jgi:hypothetical protein
MENMGIIVKSKEEIAKHAEEINKRVNAPNLFGVRLECAITGHFVRESYLRVERVA